MQSKRDEAGTAKVDVTLGILTAVERGTETTQRSIAGELGVAVGLVNAYIKRCIKKGLIKVQEVPPRRFAYYLTPQGFAEKSRLTAIYLSSSFEFFRSARRDCEKAIRAVSDRGWSRAVLMGVSDLCEITMICAVDGRVTLVGVVDETTIRNTYAGLPVLADMAEARRRAEVAILTELGSASAAYDTAVAAFGRDRVFVPDLLAAVLNRGRQSSGSAA